jgi:hypothetical protein
MTPAFYIKEIKEIASQFDKIDLTQMDGVSLMNRVDVKYIIPIHLLPLILEEALPLYRILEVKGERLSAYESKYFDTQDLDLYHHHQSGKGSRYKIRFRTYLNSSLSFLEIKHKNNKGRTIKKRIEGTPEDVFSPQMSQFLEKTSPYHPCDIQENLGVYYRRMTLVNRTSPERLTIDINLQFQGNNQEVTFPKIAIAEVKQEQLGASPIINIFRKYNLREGSISKYCLGVISTQPTIKYNRFKTKYLHLQKTINQYDLFAINNYSTSNPSKYSMA